ncbi:MAG: hypothetical protein D6717_10315 [Gammaproteobacteria bacterium]|nr:MAG: hypothetical protein D6717_10315 [Gammaproteobacteria bacterium]
MAGALFASAAAQAGVSMNLGATSNYLWRGVTQSNDQAAISGGLDYSHDSGFYAGTWTSSLSGGSYELDLYAGYGGEFKDFGYDLGVISYQYPVIDDYFNEVYANGSFKIINFGVAYTFGSKDDNTPEFSKGDLYGHLGADFELPEGFGLGLVVGAYNFDDPAGEDYVHYGVSLSKSDFTLGIEKNDKTDTGAGEDKPRVVVSWSKEF